MGDIPSIPGAEALATWFGQWPSFHDAEIHELHLNRQGVSWLKIHTWHMTDRVDDKGYYVLEKHVMVTFSLKQMATLVLDGFSHQNVISELMIEQARDGLVMTIEPCYGLSGIIEAKEINIEFTPIEPFWGFRMTFLAFDTSGEMCVLALAEDDGTVRAVTIFEGRRTLSRRLMGELDSLLTRSGLTLPDVTAFAVGLGPGSFTGIRVGVTTAKTLAQVTGKPLVGVGTLDAYAAVWPTPGDLPIAPVLPSRRGEVYAAVYRNGETAEKPFAAPVEALAARLAEMDGVVVCGAPLLLPDWTGRSLAQPWTPPEGLARIAARRLAAGDTDDPLGLVPLYVVAPSISTPKVRAPDSEAQP